VQRRGALVKLSIPVVVPGIAGFGHPRVFRAEYIDQPSDLEISFALSTARISHGNYNYAGYSTSASTMLDIPL
jgi:hypothetical protein